jgi:hypothetical protein
VSVNTLRFDINAMKSSGGLIHMVPFPFIELACPSCHTPRS